MEDVLEQVAIAFEEDGVNHSVLDELKKVWPDFLFLYRSYIFILLSHYLLFPISMNFSHRGDMIRCVVGCWRPF